MFLPLGDDIDKRSLPAVGSLLVGINVLAFVYEMRLMSESRSGAAIVPFIQAWGLVPAALKQGHVETLVTSMFLHGDLVHLLGNMLMLWAFVGTLERALGPIRFLLLYILWGVIAGLAHAGMEWGSTMPMIGASGAVSGMIGAYFVAFGALTNIRTMIWFFRPFIVRIPAGAFVFVWVLDQLFGMQAAQELGENSIAWYAHAGGFVAGAVTMLIFAGEIKNNLVLSREGAVEFQQRAKKSIEPAEPVAFVCTYCGVDLDPDRSMSENLFRCPNDKCGRLVYLN